MNGEYGRYAFGGAAFAMCAGVIFAVLSPYVPVEKESIANIILGNVLSWPAIILAFFFGTTQQSRRKDDVIARLADSSTYHVDPTQEVK